MSGHCRGRLASDRSGREFKALTLCLLILAGGLLPLAGCGSGEQETSPAPPSPQGAAPQGAAAQGAAVQPAADPDDEDRQEAVAQQPVPDAPFDLSYLDAETELFIFARPAAIAASPFVQSFTGGSLGPIDQMTGGIGISIDQIDTVTVGVRHLQDMAEQSQRRFAHLQKRSPAAAMAGMRAPQEAADETIVVVRTAGPTSAEALGLEEPGGDSEALVHQSQKYYPLPAARAPKPYLYIADEKTLVIASQNTIKQVIEQGEEVSQPQVDLSFIAEAGDVVVALVPKDRDALFNTAHQMGLGSGDSQPGAFGSGAANAPKRLRFGIGAGEDDDDLDEDDDDDRRSRGHKHKDRDRDRRGTPAAASEDLGSLLAAHTEAVALLANISSGLEIEVAVRCDDPASAVKVKATLDKTLKAATQSFEEIRETLPGVIQQIADAVMDTIQTADNGQVVTLSLALPESQQANLTMLPMAVMGMMMAGPGMSAGDMEPIIDWQARAREVADQGQPPVAAGDLPTGLELRALARWGVPPTGGGSSAVPLEIAVVATGELAARTVAFGQLKLTELNVGEAHHLKWLGAAQAERGRNPVREFVPIDRSEIFARHPEGGVATGFTFGLTGELPPALPAIAGTFTIKAAENVREVTVNRLPPAGRGSDDEALRAVGFTAETEQGNGFASIVFTYEDSPSIGTIEVLDPQGTPIPAGSWERISVGQQVRQTIHLPGNADPAELGYRVTVFDDVQEIPIAFRFEELPLPPPPENTGEPTTLAMWTPVERLSDAIPDGLVIEAQARWNAPQTDSFDNPFGNQAGNAFAGEGKPSGGGLLGRGFGFGSNEDDEDGGEPLNDRKAEKRRRRKKKSHGRHGDDDDDIPPPRSRNRSGTSPKGRGGLGFSAEEDDDTSGSGNAFGSGSFSGDGEASLQLAIDLTGPVAQSIIGLGELSVGAAVSSDGDQLDFEGSQFLGSDITEDWVDVDTQIVALGDQPPDGLRVLVLFTPPDPPIETLSQLRGTLRIRTAREQTESVVRNLNDRTDRRIKDRHLGKFGIVIAVAIEDNQLKLRVLEGDEDRIAEMYPVDRNGDRIADVFHSEGLDNGNLIHYFDFPRRVPSKVGLKFFMNLGIKEIEIPLRLRDVPVPPRPAVIVPIQPATPGPTQRGRPAPNKQDGAAGRGTSATES